MSFILCFWILSINSSTNFSAATWSSSTSGNSFLPYLLLDAEEIFIGCSDIGSWNGGTFYEAIIYKMGANVYVNACISI